jgi:hypothetical protein
MTAWFCKWMEKGSVVLHTCLLWWQTSKVRGCMCSLVAQPCLACLFHWYTLTQRFTNSSRIWANLQILGTSDMTWYKFYTEHLQLWDDVWNSLLSSAFCSVNEKQFTSVWKQKNCRNYTENIRYHHSGSQAPIIDAPFKFKESKLLLVICSCNFHSIRTKSSIWQ